MAIQLKKKVKIEIETLSNLMQLRAFISAKSKKKYLALRTKKRKKKEPQTAYESQNATSDI